MSNIKTDFEYYYISSADRLNGTIEDFNIELRNLFNIHAYHIERISIPYTFYPFRNNVNNQIGVRINNSDSIVTIEEGNYASITDFVSELQTKLQVVSNHFQVSYNSRKGLLTISTANASNFDLYFLTGDSRRGNSMFREIGFNPVNKSGASTYTSDYPINISGFDYIIIECPDINQFQKIHSTNNYDYKTLAKVPINVAWGSTISHSANLNVLHNMDINFKSKVVNFKLLDQFRRPLNIKNDWELKLKLYTDDEFINI